MFRYFSVVMMLSSLVLPVWTAHAAEGAEEKDPAEVAIGERLFRETRFSQFFYSQSRGNVNARLDVVDPTTYFTETSSGKIRNPYGGKGMNCASCHFVDEHAASQGGGSRAYSDFARRSPIPDRGDGKTTTPRNSPAFVNASLDRPNGFFLHADAEFNTLEDLVVGGFTGRNYGWLADESEIALAQIAKVIRQDDGTNELAASFGGSYGTVLAGLDASIPEEFRLPENYRLDIKSASDRQIVDAVARLVAAYLKSLEFSRDSNGEFNGSAYDVFLAKNDLPRKAAEGESDLAYARRLLGLIEKLESPKFVGPEDGSLKLHAQEFRFGAEELKGLKIFLAEPGRENAPRGGVGNCVSCHAPPTFTDFSFHNTGASQFEYDSIHGRGKFARLSIPSFAERIARPEAYLPASALYPRAEGVYRDAPSADKPGHADLGLWNVFGNPDMPAPQEELRMQLCKLLLGQGGVPDCSFETLLPYTVGRFKTAQLRDLGHSAPYFHSGDATTLEDAVQRYVLLSIMAQNGEILNGDPALARMSITARDVAPLAAFLKALNEDYE